MLTQSENMRTACSCFITIAAKTGRDGAPYGCSTWPPVTSRVGDSHDLEFDFGMKAGDRQVWGACCTRQYVLTYVYVEACELTYCTVTNYRRLQYDRNYIIRLN